MGQCGAGRTRDTRFEPNSVMARGVGVTPASHMLATTWRAVI